MSRRLRLVLILAGLIILGVSLILLAYASWPITGLHEQATLAPALFTPP